MNQRTAINGGKELLAFIFFVYGMPSQQSFGIRDSSHLLPG